MKHDYVAVAQIAATLKGDDTRYGPAFYISQAIDSLKVAATLCGACEDANYWKEMYAGLKAEDERMHRELNTNQRLLERRPQ